MFTSLIISEFGFFCSLLGLASIGSSIRSAGIGCFSILVGFGFSDWGTFSGWTEVTGWTTTSGLLGSFGFLATSMSADATAAINKVLWYREKIYINVCFCKDVNYKLKTNYAINTDHIILLYFKVNW